MADRKILSIPVDSTEFDELVAKVQAHQKMLEQMPEAWRGHNQGAAEAVEHGEGLSSAFENAHKHTSKLDSVFSRFARATTDGKMSGNDSFISKFERSSKAIETSWTRIEKAISKSQKELIPIDRMGTRFGAFGKTLLGAAGVGIAAAGTVMKTEANVAAENLSSKELNLPLGQEAAFKSYFSDYGFSRKDLETAADNAGDVTKYSPYGNAHISMDTFNKDNAEQLAVDSAKAMGAMFGEWEKTNPQTAITNAKAMGFTDVFSISQLRAFAKETPAGDIDRQQDLFNKNWQRMGVEQSAADKASEFDSHKKANWKEVTTAFDNAELILAPALNKWSDAATKFTVSFLNQAAPQVKQVLDDLQSDQPVAPPADGQAYPNTLEGGLRKFGDWVRGNLPKGTTLPGPGGPVQIPKTITQGGMTFSTDPDRIAHMKELEGMLKLPGGLLNAQEKIESAGGTNLVGKGGKYLGARQFDAATAERYHVNRFDEQSSTEGAAKDLADLHAKYKDWKKAIAAYDGFTGLDKDIKDHGNDWLKFAPKETQKYIASLKDQGVDLGEPMALDNAKASRQAAASDKSMAAQAKAPPVSGMADNFTNWLGDQVKGIELSVTKLTAALGEGGGAQYRNDPRPINPKVAVTSNINVKVSAPAGSNVAVTAASLQQ